MVKNILLDQLLLILLLVFSFQKNLYADQQKTPILIKSPGSYQLTSEHQNLVNFKTLVNDCFNDEGHVSTEKIDPDKIIKIISDWLEISESVPIIHCRALVSAYKERVSEQKL